MWSPTFSMKTNSYFNEKVKIKKKSFGIKNSDLDTQRLYLE